MSGISYLICQINNQINNKSYCISDLISNIAHQAYQIKPISTLLVHLHFY